jgi:predicted ester cyclase
VGDSRAVSAVRLAVAALNDGHVDAYLASFDPRCQRWISGFEQPLDFDDVGASLRQMGAAFDGLRLDEDLLFGDEQFVCARWRMRGRHVDEYLGVAPTGRSIDVETCEVYEVADGVVITTWVYGDVLGQLVGQLAADTGTVARAE